MTTKKNMMCWRIGHHEVRAEAGGGATLSIWGALKPGELREFSAALLEAADWLDEVVTLEHQEAEAK